MDEQIVEWAPASLDLSVDDDKIISSKKEFIKKYEEKVEELDITDRRKKNETYLFGKQLDSHVFKSYEKKIVDNVIKEGEDNVKSLVLSKLPDIIVKGTGGASEIADNLTKVGTDRLTSGEMKEILGMAFEHLPVDLISCIKYRWDPHAGRRSTGDVVFESIDPENLAFDVTARKAQQKLMSAIVHFVEKSVREWIMMFPKEEDFIRDTAETKMEDGQRDEEKIMGYNLKIGEMWFDWFEKAEDFDAEDNPKFDFFSGVAWILEDKVLKKMKNPNWDWEGESHFFFNGEPVSDDLMAQAMAVRPDLLSQMEEKKVFRNYFKTPRKPFIFMRNEQWGDSPFEKTSRIEQNLTLQDNYDTRNMRITKMIDDARGKHVFSKLSGLKKDTIEKMDLNNPDEDLVIDGDLRQVHAFIQPELPPAQMFSDLERTRNRILSRVHINPATRGEIVTSTATTNQIAREGDFANQDDLADDTINPVAIEISEALLHMMKLRGTPEYFQDVLGEEAEETQLALTADDIDDGMIVEITASATDKLKAERQAKEEAQLQVIDPYSYFVDTGRKDPEERVTRLILFQNAPELYLKKYGEGQSLQEIAQEAQTFGQQAVEGAQQQFGQSQGQTTQERQLPSPTNTTDVATAPQGRV